MEITHDYFLEECHKFRAIMCSPTYTPKQKFDAFGGLIQAHLQGNDNDVDNAEIRKIAWGMVLVCSKSWMDTEAEDKLDQLIGELYDVCF